MNPPAPISVQEGSALSSAAAVALSDAAKAGEGKTALALLDQECPALEGEEAADADSLRQDWAETEL